MRAELKALMIDFGELLIKFEDIDLGYDKGENCIYPPLPEEAVLNTLEELDVGTLRSLGDFYCVCNGVVLENIYNGYFIDDLSRVAKSVSSNELSEIRGAGELDGPVVVIGNDGGGGWFAIKRDSGEVLYLPESAVDYGVYDGSYAAPKLISKDIIGFLIRLRDDISADIEGDDSHEYITD